MATVEVELHPSPKFAGVAEEEAVGAEFPGLGRVVGVQRTRAGGLRLAVDVSLERAEEIMVALVGGRAEVWTLGRTGPPWWRRKRR